jgi:hypothetical protein
MGTWKLIAIYILVLIDLLCVARAELAVLQRGLSYGTLSLQPDTMGS